MQLNDDGLPHRIDGRIGDLGKSLAEEGVDRTRRMRQGRQRCIVSHRPDGILAVAGHGASTMRTSSGYSQNTCCNWVRSSTAGAEWGWLQGVSSTNSL